MNQLIQFTYLQILDMLTTIAFMLSGVREGNPIVSAIILHTASPLGGLLLIKTIGILLGVYCWRIRKLELLKRANILFALLVMWNIVALIMATYNGIKA